MNNLAKKHNAVNLAQGFPENPIPKQIVDSLFTAIQDGYNQYAPMPGTIELRNSIATKTALHYGTKFDPETEITVTAGGTSGIFTAINTIINSGDEVIIFEPAYELSLIHI